MMKGSMEVQFHLHKKDFKETDHLKDHFHGKVFYRTGNGLPLAKGHLISKAIYGLLTSSKKRTDLI